MRQELPSSPLGVLPHYAHTRGGVHAPSVREVLRQIAKPARWDLDGVRLYLERRPDGERTCFKDVRLVPPRERPMPSGAGLRAALEHAVDDIVHHTRRAAVALSGGLDSALVVALLRARGCTDIPVFTLASHLPGYCELPATRDAAHRLGVMDLQVIEINSRDMTDAFAGAITAAECPLFNLHPVSRWLLAKRLREAGYEVLITGDGADQVFAGSDPRNHLPIIGALTRAAGLELRSPFLHADVMAAAPPPTPDKAALRAVAAALLPAKLCHLPKRATYAPPLDVSAHWHDEPVQELAARLQASARPLPGSRAESVLWTSLGILASFLHYP